MKVRTLFANPGWDKGPPTDGWLLGFSRVGKLKVDPILPIGCWVLCWCGRWLPIGAPELPLPAPKPRLPGDGTWGTAPTGPWTAPRDGMAYGWDWGPPWKGGKGTLGTGYPAGCTPGLWVPLGGPGGI